MRLLLALFLIFFIFFSCRQQQKETPNNQDSLSQAAITLQGTIKKNYQPLDTDTVVSEQEISLHSEPYNLKIIKYCLNDSAVVREVGFDANASSTNKTYDISHNYSVQIILTKDNKTIFDKQIFKDALKGLFEGDYKWLKLYEIRYDFVKTNRLYFKATLASPITNWAEEIAFAVFYQTEKAGQLDFSNVDPNRVTYNDLEIYNFMPYDKNPNEKVGFITLSDNYPLSEHPDSLAIPDLYSIKNDESVEDDESTEDDEAFKEGEAVDDTYFKLESKYRQRFLAKTKISETDRVFIYNYYNDSLASFIVKDLNVVAALNMYRSEDDRPHSQSDYMIGFEIDENVLKSFGASYYSTFVYIGKENPFITGQLKPIAWKKIEPAAFPSRPVSTKNTIRLRAYDKGSSVYKYVTADFEYFVQDFAGDNGMSSARRLLVIDPGTKEAVRDILAFSGESTSMAPLYLADDPHKFFQQWTGKLFKNKPPVMFGFEYESFGCPHITFLNKYVTDVYINCDNRH